MATGHTNPVTGEGSIALSDTLHLESVLLVPSLSYNLLSVSQITKSLACAVTFWPTYCLFQDILTQKTLGYGVRRDNLYILDLTDSGVARMGQTYFVTKAASLEDEILKMKSSYGIGDWDICLFST